MSTEELQSLKNIGPAVAEKLIKAGIETPERIRELGAEAVFWKIFESSGFGGQVHAAWLYAIWGAIHDVPFTRVPIEKRNEFKALTAKIRKCI